MRKLFKYIITSEKALSLQEQNTHPLRVDSKSKQPMEDTPPPTRVENSSPQKSSHLEKYINKDNKRPLYHIHLC